MLDFPSISLHHVRTAGLWTGDGVDEERRNAPSLPERKSCRIAALNIYWLTTAGASFLSFWSFVVREEHPDHTDSLIILSLIRS